jgi:hypothetical protein
MAPPPVFLAEPLRLVLVGKALVEDLEVAVILDPPVAHLSFRALMKSPHRLSPHLLLESFSFRLMALLVTLGDEALYLGLRGLGAAS